MPEDVERRLVRLENQYDNMSRQVNDILILVKTNDVRNEDSANRSKEFVDTIKTYIDKHDKAHVDILKRQDKSDRFIYGAYVVALVLGFVASPIGQKVFNLIFN